MLPKSTCLTLYNTLILPLFDYCSFVWDSCGLGDKTHSEKLNRRAACIIECRSVPYEDLRNVLGWPSLVARREYLKCILVVKSLHNMAPSYLLSNFKQASQIHTYNTRGCDLLRPPRAKTKKYQGSFVINGTCAFNALPHEIRSVEGLSVFKRKCKECFKNESLT